MEDADSEKEAIRRRVWNLMEEKGVSRFPKPVFGRIPNFAGAEEAARKLAEQREFQRAEVVKVNPDAPQQAVRFAALSDGKTLLMPSPRLRKGFLVLDPRKIIPKSYAKASTIKGSFKHGVLCPLRELPEVHLIVAGSVAVSKEGVRVGKGGGYSEIEYAVLRETGAVREETPLFTTVHDVQVVDWAPKELHDLAVDVVVTPTRILRVERKCERPKGILWEKISQRQLESIPVLSELRQKTRK